MNPLHPSRSLLLRVMASVSARSCVILRMLLVSAAVLAATGRLCAGEGDRAGPGEEERSPLPESLPPRYKSVVFFGFDLARGARLPGWGIKRALGSLLDESGWRILASQSLRIGEINPVTGQRFNRMDNARLLLGYEWFTHGAVITGMAGGSLAYDRAAGGEGQMFRSGPVLSLDIWKNWDANDHFSRASTLHLTLDGAERSLYIRLRHGFARPDWAFMLGPDISISLGEGRHGARVQEGWRIMHLGLHVSEIPLFRLRLGVAGGMEWQLREKPDSYMQVFGYVRY